MVNCGVFGKHGADYHEVAEKMQQICGSASITKNVTSYTSCSLVAHYLSPDLKSVVQTTLFCIFISRAHQPQFPLQMWYSPTLNRGIEPLSVCSDILRHLVSMP